MNILANFAEGIFMFIKGFALFVAWIIMGLPIVVLGIVFCPTVAYHLWKACDCKTFLCRHWILYTTIVAFPGLSILGTLTYFTSTPFNSFWLWFSRVSIILFCTNLLSGIYELGCWHRGKIAKDEADYKAKLEAHRAQGGVGLPPPEPWPEPRKPTP